MATIRSGGGDPEAVLPLEPNQVHEVASNGHIQQSDAKLTVTGLLREPRNTENYESFERLVEDTTTHSAELLRRVLVMPEIAKREADRVRAEVGARLEAEREWQRMVLIDLQTELEASRQRMEHLSASLRDLHNDFVRLSELTSDALAEIEARDAPDSLPAPDDDVDASRFDDRSTGTGNFAPESELARQELFRAGETLLAPDAVRIDNSAETNDDSRSRPTDPLSRSPGATDQVEAGVSAERELTSVSLVIHGIRPTAALSLRSYLAELPHIADLSVRDYAADALHAELSVLRPLEIADFSEWSGHSALEVISQTTDSLELRFNPELSS